MKSNWLFQLIHTLTKAEKRHFKLHHDQYHKKGESQHIRLFDRLSVARSFEEERLKADFLVGHWSVMKNQLFHKVLGSLVDQYQERTAYAAIQLLIQKSDMLYQRKLFKASEQLLKRAAKKAEALELFECLMIIYQRWKRLYVFVLGVDNRAHHIRRFWELEQKALAQMANLREMEWASMQLFDWYYRHHYAKSAEEKEAYRRLAAHPLFSDIGQARSFSAKVIYLNTLGLYNDGIGNKEVCTEYRAQLVHLYQSYPHFIRERATQYLAATNNWILGLIHLREYERATTALADIRDFPAQLGRAFKGEEEVMWFRLYHSLRLEVWIRRWQFRQAGQSIPETELEIRRLGNKLNEVFRLPFYYFFAYALFATGRHEEALDRLEPLVHKDHLSFRSELFRYGRILYLVLHYELENYDLLASLCRSTLRYLKKLGALTPVEKLLLDFFGKAPHSNRKGAHKELLAKLQPLSEASSATAALHHFHYLAWCRGHAEGCGFLASLPGSD